MSANLLSDCSGVRQKVPEATRQIYKKAIETIAHAIRPVTGSAIYPYPDCIGCKPVIETMLQEMIY